MASKYLRNSVLLVKFSDVAKVPIIHIYLCKHEIEKHLRVHLDTSADCRKKKMK